MIYACRIFERPRELFYILQHTKTTLGIGMIERVNAYYGYLGLAQHSSRHIVEQSFRRYVVGDFKKTVFC